MKFINLNCEIKHFKQMIDYRSYVSNLSSEKIKP